MAKNGNGKPPKPVADRVRAHRVRERERNGKEVSDDDAAYKDDYEATASPSAAAAAFAAAGRSASASKVTEFRQEERAAAAEGSHLHPDAYASIARSEGLRADTLLRVASSALIQVNQQAFALVELCYKRLEAVETAHVGMMHAVRDHYLARTEAEAQQIRLQELHNLESEEGQFAQFMQFMELAAKHKKSGSGKKRKREPLGSP